MKNLLHIFFLLLPFFSFSQSQFILAGGAEDDQGNSVCALPGGAAVAAGWSMSNGDSMGNVMLVKANADGSIAWTKFYGGDDEDGATDIRLLSDGGFIIAGHTGSYSLGFCDFYVLRTDSLGDTLWTASYGTVLDEAASAVNVLPDGSFSISGFSGPEASHYPSLLKLDGNGALQWMKFYPCPGQSSATFHLLAEDGGFYLCGYEKDSATGIEDMLVIRTDANGNLLWKKKFDQGERERAYSMCYASDSSLILCGVRTNIASDSFDILLSRVDINGNLSWMFHIPMDGFDYGYAVAPAGNDEFIATGISNLEGTDDVAWIKFDINGNIIENKSIVNPGADAAFEIRPTYEGGWLFCGRSDNNAAGGDDLMILKTDSLGNVLSTEYPVEEKAMIMYPVPAHTVLNICVNELEPIIWLQVTNLSGQISTLSFSESDEWLQLNVTGLAPGIYGVEILDSYGQRQRGKFCVMN